MRVHGCTLPCLPARLPCPAQYYLDTQVLPSLMREHKLHAAWAAAGKRYHDTLWKFNTSYDRELRYTAISKNQVLEHIHHTTPKSIAEHVDKMVAANKKIYDAFTPGSKRLMIWQSATRWAGGRGRTRAPCMHARPRARSPHAATAARRARPQHAPCTPLLPCLPLQPALRARGARVGLRSRRGVHRLSWGRGSLGV